jgi:hypothetical protein
MVFFSFFMTGFREAIMKRNFYLFLGVIAIFSLSIAATKTLSNGMKADIEYTF